MLTGLDGPQLTGPARTGPARTGRLARAAVQGTKCHKDTIWYLLLSKIYVARRPDALFSLQKVDHLFLVVALKTQRQPTLLRLFHCQNETNKVVSGQIPQNFCFLLTLLLKQSKAIGRAEPGRWIFQPGHLTWRALV